MAFTKSTEEVQSEIIAWALERHRGDLDSMQRSIDKEIDAFRRFQTIDLSRFPEVRQTLLRYAFAMGESWSERLDYIGDALEDYSKFIELEDVRIKPKELDRLKSEIVSSSKQPSSGIPSCSWLDELEKACDRLHEQNRYRKYEQILPDLELIVGTHFNNETTGDFRYPITFYDSESKKVTRRSTIKDISPDVAVVGHYQVGANALMIIRALMDVVEKLEVKFNIDMATSSDGG